MLEEQPAEQPEQTAEEPEQEQSQVEEPEQDSHLKKGTLQKITPAQRITMTTKTTESLSTLFFY